jgi:hypothetical protein
LSTIRLCARAGESTAALPIIRYRIGVPPNRDADRYQPARNPPSGRVFTWGPVRRLFTRSFHRRAAGSMGVWQTERRGGLAVDDHTGNDVVGGLNGGERGRPRTWAGEAPIACGPSWNRQPHSSRLHQGRRGGQSRSRAFVSAQSSVFAKHARALRRCP